MAVLRITSDRNRLGNGTPNDEDVWPSGTQIELRGAHLEVIRDLDDVVFVGTGTVKVGGHVLSRCVFTGEAGARPNVNFDGAGVLLHARGAASINLGRASPTIIGDDDGFELLSLSGPGNEDSGELENVIITRLDDRHLKVLTQLKRLKIHWPRKPNGGVDRDQAVKAALGMDMRVSDRGTRSRRLAHFWENLYRALRRQAADGRTESVSREIAFEARRRAAPVRSPEWWLLGVSSVFGYGARVGRPLAIWFGIALATALAMSLRIEPSPGFSALAFDLTFAPTTFFRSLGAEDAIYQVLQRGGLPVRVGVQLVRVVTTASLVFAAVAIRSYTRITA